MSTKDNVISTDYIKMGEKTAFIKSMDKFRKYRIVTITAIVMLTLGITYIALLNKFFILLQNV